MGQKKIWMNYLLTGISVLFLVLISACGQGEEDCLVKFEHLFINDSNFKIDLGLGVILPNENFNFLQESIGSCNSEVIANDYALPFQTNTFVVNEEQCKTFVQTSINEGEGPFDITNYNTEKISDQNFKLTYIFKNEDFDGITNCD